MKINIALYAISLSAAAFLFSSSAIADCAVTGATPSGGEIVNCTGTDLDGYSGTINIDEVSIQVGAILSGPSHVISPGDGDDTVTMFGGSIVAGGDGLKGGLGNDTITFLGGSMDVDGDGIDGDSGDDTITVSGGTINSTNDDGIDGGSGNDIISISGATVTSSASDGENINANSGNDTVILGTGANINATINCGHDTDTLEFAMAVASAELSAAQAAVGGASPAGDTITISGLSYTWIECESIVDSLTEDTPPPAEPPPSETTM